MNLGRIYRCSLALLVALWVAPQLTAQQPRPTTSSRHTLWKIEGKSSAVYLLGSVHVLKAENYPLPAEMEAAFTNSAIVVFEADMDAMEQPEVQQKVMSKALLPAGETLPQQLSAPVYTLFTNHLKEAQLPAGMFDMFKPSMAAITLAVIEIRKLGLDPEFGLDKHFHTRARKAGKKILALETVDFQIGLVTDFTREEEELLMKTTLENLDKTKKELRELLAAWQTGDSDKLEQLLNEAAREAPVIYKRLVTDRNQRWVPQIEEWLRGKQNALVVVGAGHLVGSDGVVELLRKKGLTVTQQ